MYIPCRKGLGMALNLVTGGSGSGKSCYVYNKIMEQSAAEPHTNFLIIVPEQFTMQTQKDIVMLSKAKGIMNIDVLSFMRLAYRVLEKTSALARPVLADEGKGMVIRRILREHADEWKTFGGNINRQGFVEEIKSIITEFLQYRVTYDSLKQLEEAVTEKKVLTGKLNDLELVYRYYREYMEERYISVEEILELLIEYLPESELIKDSVICIDGFTGLTPVQYVLLGELLKVCRDVYITVTIDNDEDIMSASEPFELFHMSKCYIHKVMKVANKSGADIGEIYRAGSNDRTGVSGSVPWRFRGNPWLAALEKGIYRRSSRNKINIPETVRRTIHIYEGASPYEECEYVVWKIRQLVRESGRRYRDMAVVTGDVNLYQRLLGEELGRADIPYFMDSNKGVLTNALVDMIRSLLNVVNNKYKGEDIIRLLRCAIIRDYLGYAMEDTDIIENYIIASGIRGIKGWNREWKSSKYDEEQLVHINEYRLRVVELIQPFYEKISGCMTVLDYSKAVYEFLADNNINEVTDKIAEDYESKGMLIEHREYVQIYRIVINIIDQMAVLMGDEEVSLSEYISLLGTGFSEASVGVIPPGIDCVIVGDIERTRLKDIKVLFFAGVNDGVIPKAVKQGGYLSDIEREYLLEHGAELAPAMRELIFNERFYLYLNVTKPSEGLYLSYSRKSSSGDELEPSSLITQIKNVVGDIPVDRDYRSTDAYTHLGNDGGKSWWIEGLRRAVDTKDEFYKESENNTSGDWLELHREWMSDNEGRSIFDSAFYNGSESSISADIARILYGRELCGSVSRLELFASCAFAHFLKYGLRLKERPEYIVDVPDIGIMFHNVIAGFSERLKAEGLRWQDADEDIIEQWSKDITDEVCNDYGNGVMKDNARNEYMKERIRRISCSTINALADHMRKGSFEASGYELSFEGMAVSDILNLNIDEDRIMHLTGRIDRLDVCETDDNVYIKVIDYKSGNRTFDIEDVYYGLDMQLIVYLAAAGDVAGGMNRDKIVIPAGAFYFHMDDPVIDDSGNDEENEENLRHKFRMNGPVNATPPVPVLIDNTLGDSSGNLYAGAVSDIVKIAVTSKGMYDMRRSSVIDNKYFDYVKKYVSDLIKQYGCRILDGDTAIAPYKLGDKKGCSYCEYAAVCGFDARLEGNCYRKLDKKSSTEIWEELKKKYES